MSRFVWYDLMTDDCKTAASFYGKVVGWGAADSGMPGPEYTIFSVGSSMVGGMLAITPEARANGARPCWTGYIYADDVDAYVSRVTAAGGAVHRPPEDIPGVGRFAVVTDPHGAAFILFKPNRDGGPPEDVMSPARVGWHELHAGDGEKDFAFYSQLFGWTKFDSVDMGPMGPYVTFASDGVPIGGIVNKTAETPIPYWLYYFVVDDLDAAVGRVKEHGGSIWNGPVEVPGGSWVAACEDPTGATFALVRPPR